MSAGAKPRGPSPARASWASARASRATGRNSRTPRRHHAAGIHSAPVSRGTCLTSATTLVLYSDGSQKLSGAMPLSPASSRCQHVRRSGPSDVLMPIPVMTTLCISFQHPAGDGWEKSAGGTQLLAFFLHDLGGVAQQESLADQILHDAFGILLRGFFAGEKGDLRIERRFVGIVHAGEALDLASAGFTVKAFHIPLLANFDRSIHKRLDKGVVAHHGAHPVAGLAIRAYRRADDGAVMPHEFRCHIADAHDIGVAIFARKAQAFGQVGAHDVAIQDGYLPAVFHQHDR